MASEVNPALINSLLPDNGDEELLGGAAAKTEREIIESNRVKLANYIHDVTTLFPLLRQEGIFSRDDVEIIESRVTTTAKVDKCLDVLLRKGPEAIGVFHEALSSHYRHLFNYLAQLFTQAGLQLPPSRQMKDEEQVLWEETDPLDIRHSRSYSTYRNGSRSVTIRKRLEVMSRQCEMMGKEKDGLQRALGDREREISSLLSTKEHVQTSLNSVQGKYQELLTQLAHWRAVLESDDAVKQWTIERENIQREYDQMEQEYNLQCSELNAARERISLLLQQLERSEKVVCLTQENSQKEKDTLKRKIVLQEGEIQRLRSKLDFVITSPAANDTRGTSGECPQVRCEKLQRDLDRANDQISTLNARLEVLQKERRQAFDERDESTSKLYHETLKRKHVEKENKKMKIQIDSISNCSDPLNSPQTPHKPSAGNWLPPTQSLPRHSSYPGEEGGRIGAVKVENMEVFMPAPRVDEELGMKLELGIVVKELKDGSLPHKHGVRIGDEICQVNKFSLYGDRPLEFFNRLLFSATQPVTLMLRRQVPSTDPGRLCNTLPLQIPLCASPLTSRPISPCLPHSLPFNTPSSAIFPANLSVGANTLSRKSPAFQSPTMAGSPIHGPNLESSLDSKILAQPIGRVNTETSNSIHSTNKEFSSSSSSDEDGSKVADRSPVIIPQQKYNRLSITSDQTGPVCSPTEKSPCVWKDNNRLTRISTIDSGFEFPFDQGYSYEDENMRILDSEKWDVVDPVEADLGMEERGGGGEGGIDEEEGGRGREGSGGSNLRRRANVRGSGGALRRENKRVYKKQMYKSQDNNEGKPVPVRMHSRSGERTVTITKEEFTSEIKLIGGRGYGMFIETDSKKHTVETGDKILEVGDRCVHSLTRAEVFELLDTCFLRNDSAQLSILYDAKALSQLPPDAKDNFYVRCTQYHRPAHSLLSKNTELAFEKGDVLHITNTLPTGHVGFWIGQKVSSKGEMLAVGLIPMTLTSEQTDEGSPSLPQRFRSPKSSPKNNAHSMDDLRPSLPSASKALNIYRPIRRVYVQDPRPLVLLGALQKDIRRHLVTHHHTGSVQDDIKFCFPTRDEADKPESYAEEDVVETLKIDGKTMISTASHIKELAREGYHCVLCCDADGLRLPGLQNLTPIVLLLHATTVRVVNKIRQRLSQDGDCNAQEEIDYVESLKRYRQYITGQIDLQGSMCDVMRDIRTTVARQQKSVIWENDS